MGAWGVAAFDNDDAMDWLIDLADEGPELLESTLDIAAQGAEAPEAANALAAAEMVAAAHGHPSTALPPEAVDWLHDTAAIFDAAPLVPLARQAVQRVRGESELRQLWEQSDSYAQWTAALDDLEKRLR